MILLIINLKGLSSSFSNNLIINFIGFIIKKSISDFKTLIIRKLIFIKILLNNSIYITIPNAIPIKIYALNSPLLNLKIEYKIISVAKIQKIISSIYVIKSVVLNDFLRILNKSNKMEIKKPFNIKIINKYA